MKNIETDYESSVSIVITIISAVGIYNLLVMGLIFLMENWKWLKKIILGNYYLEGTWVGYFTGEGKDKRYVVEIFEQDLYHIQIKGQSYTENGELHAQWTSESTSIDVEKGRLIYSYSCDIITHEVTLQGIGIFDLKRKNKKNAATAIQGYIADLNKGIRLPVHEIKLDNKLLNSNMPFKEIKKLVNKNFA